MTFVCFILRQSCCVNVGLKLGMSLLSQCRDGWVSLCSPGLVWNSQSSCFSFQSPEIPRASHAHWQFLDLKRWVRVTSSEHWFCWMQKWTSLFPLWCSCDHMIRRRLSPARTSPQWWWGWRSSTPGGVLASRWGDSALGLLVPCSVEAFHSWP